jgi:hypothetical protein
MTVSPRRTRPKTRHEWYTVTRGPLTPVATMGGGSTPRWCAVASGLADGLASSQLTPPQTRELAGLAEFCVICVTFRLRLEAANRWVQGRHGDGGVRSC